MQKLSRYALGLLALAALLGHAAGFYSLGLISRLDAIIYDTRLRLTMPNSIDERIVILDIDEKSLAEVGRWPWNRDRLVQLVSKAFEQYGIALLGMDDLFAESDESSGLAVLEQLASGPLQANEPFRAALHRLRPKLDYDGRFAETIAKYPVILGFAFTDGAKETSTGTLPAPVLSAEALRRRGVAATVFERYSGNRPEFQRAALGAGHYNGLADFDGLSRRVALVAEYAGNYYEALSLAVARAALGNPKLVPSFSPAGPFSSSDPTIEAIELLTGRGTVRIPVDRHVRALIPYRGAQGSYRYYSAADVLAERVSKDAMRGKIALLGTTAPGLLDQRATPVGEIYPGVEVHANMLSGILDGTVKSQPAYVSGVEMLLLVLVALVLLFWLPRFSPLRATLGFAALLAFLIALNFAFWEFANLVLPLASIIVLALVLYAFNMSFGYVFETHAKQRLAQLFGHYVPPELVEEMSRNPDRYDMEGRSAELTVMFADIRGFTALSEGLAPQTMAYLMKEYFSAMTQVIRANRGTLDKYIGDAIMAFWGAPVDDSLHALNAVITAMEMQRMLTEINLAFKARSWPELTIGIGINSGTMTVGDMGSRERKAYTVLGDPVNLADRLEGLTAYYGVGIIMGEAVQEILPDIECRELDQVRVKGRARSVRIYQPMGVRETVGVSEQNELVLWRQALTQYRAQDWGKAEAILKRLAASAPHCRLYSLYLERLVTLRVRQPVSSWDGVWQFDTS
jgi:adenylate cyclase